MLESSEEKLMAKIQEIYEQKRITGFDFLISLEAQQIGALIFATVRLWSCYHYHSKS